MWVGYLVGSGGWADHCGRGIICVFIASLGSSVAVGGVVFEAVCS